MIKTGFSQSIGLGLALSLAGCGDDSRAGNEGHADDGIGSLSGVSGDGTGANPGHTSADGPSSDGSDEEAGDDGPKFDTIDGVDGGSKCGVGWGEELEFSYLWAANSSQGTISKIDTKTMAEKGRYLVRPNFGGSPSRTSVSLSGRVAVASRSGGVTVFYPDKKYCKESNGKPNIQSSTSKAFLPWNDEECRAWFKAMDYKSQRPVAWGPGTLNPETCLWENEELWTAASNQDGKIDIYLLDGDDGSTKEMISVPTGDGGLNKDFFGLYGGAVDGNGDFWGSQLGSDGRLIRVNRADMSYDIWDTPEGAAWYGMTVDSEGMVWLCSTKVARFDPVTETWATATVGGWTGCMADAKDNGLLWVSAGDAVIGVNRDTLQVEKAWASAGSYGISIDFEGYVWAVAQGTNANKIDPETGALQTYSGLVGAYTYSDMTGYALSNVGKPSG